MARVQRATVAPPVAGQGVTAKIMRHKSTAEAVLPSNVDHDRLRQHRSLRGGGDDVFPTRIGLCGRADRTADRTALRCDASFGQRARWERHATRRLNIRATVRDSLVARVGEEERERQKERGREGEGGREGGSGREGGREVRVGGREGGREGREGGREEKRLQARSEEEF